MKTYHSFSSKETELLGEKLAKKMKSGKSAQFLLCRLRGGEDPRFKKVKSGKTAAVFTLRGDLGSGKTTFAKGFFRGFGIKRRVKSPTFVIFRRFKVRDPKFVNRTSRIENIYHVDAYRLKKTKDLVDLGFKEILSDPKNVILIEWPENAREVIPRGAHQLAFRYGKKENERIIKEIII